ncbi:MAG: DinB family protein [Bacteroidota bacterium]
MITKLQKLVAYSLWANRKIFQALVEHEVSDEKMINWAAHILNAEELWMDRIEGRAGGVLPFQLRNKESLLPDLENLNKRFQKLLNSFSDEELERTISYQDSRGNPYENELSDLLFHMINHETHHRSQIAARLREQGISPPPTDYLYFIR